MRFVHAKNSSSHSILSPLGILSESHSDFLVQFLFVIDLTIDICETMKFTHSPCFGHLCRHQFNVISTLIKSTICRPQSASNRKFNNYWFSTQSPSYELFFFIDFFCHEKKPYWNKWLQNNKFAASFEIYSLMIKMQSQRLAFFCCLKI